jgi:Predicted nucleotidyltransferases
MVERTIDIEIMQAIIKYVNEVSKHYKIEGIILFGSYAKGTNCEDSDIDIAVVSDNFNDDLQEERLNLMRLRRKIDLRIEPHPIRTEEFIKKEDYFIKEIINTGIKVA